MDIKTHLANALEISQDKIKYDAQIKQVLADKYVLAKILSHTTEEFKGMPVEEIVPCIDGKPQVGEVPVYPGWIPEKITGTSTEDSVPNEGVINYDIRFNVITPSEEHIKIIVNIEAQKRYDPGYDLVSRGVFYAARMISAQLDREFTVDNYDGLKKVYSVWICMDTPKYAQNTITKYSIKQEKLFGDFQGDARYDLISVVMVCLAKEKNGTIIKSNEQLIDMLSILLADNLSAAEKEKVLEEEYELPMTKTIKEDIRQMCNLSDLVEERALERGMKKGIEEGVKQGIEKGKLEGRIDMLVQLVQRGLLSMTDAAKELCLSEEAFSGLMQNR